MKILFNRLSGRFARNVYLWLALVLMKLSYFDYSYSAYELQYMFVLLFLFMGLLYLNNLVLLPGLFARKKKFFYFLTVVPVIILYAFIASSVLHFAAVTHQGLSMFKTAWIPLPDEQLRSVKVMMRASVIFSAMMLSLFSLCWYTIDHQRRTKAWKRSQAVQTQTELAFLKDQLNPHFLFNTLNNLYGLSIKKSKATPDMVLKLSSILQYLLYDSNVPLVSFNKEKEMIKAYVELELLRLSETKNFDITIFSDREDYKVPPLLWLAVVENIFKYGIYFSGLETITFRCTVVNNVMHIYSKNGYDAAEMQKHKKESSGVGLSNLRKRLQILYAGKHDLKVSQTEHHFIVEIDVKLR